MGYSHSAKSAFICFFGGPFLLKVGINSLGVPAEEYEALLYFLGFGLCYSGSVFF
jgi:hypothetical protein